MDGCNTEVVHAVVKTGYITEAHQPFGIPDKTVKVYFIEEPHSAITSPCAKNCSSICIIKSFLQVVQPLHVGSGILIMLSKNVLPGLNLISFTFKPGNSIKHMLRTNLSCC